MGRLIPLLALAALLAAPAVAAPTRVASLNLCTDELALLLAAPGQMASVTMLGADPQETPLAGRAKGLHRNNGRMESVAALAPDLVLTGGGANRYAAEMAQRLGARVVDVPPPITLDDLRRNIRIVAQALDRKGQGEALVARINAQLDEVPAERRSAILLLGGGYTVPAEGLAADLARHAGLEQQALPSVRVELEQLLLRPPEVVVLTQYRTNQASLYQSWLSHPAFGQIPETTRILEIDGRAWTCLGPLAVAEIARLRAKLAS